LVGSPAFLVVAVRAGLDRVERGEATAARQLGQRNGRTE
jgi:hypothetical protein